MKYTIRRVEETASTNDDLRRAAEEGAPEGLVIQALTQSAGKGRQGRNWSSPQGNLYASILLRPHCSPQDASLYSFVTALAVYDAVEEAINKKSPSPCGRVENALAFSGRGHITLKWPNDVLVNDKKISGILLESAPIQNGVVAWLVIGVGINIAAYPENATYPTTSLAQEGAQMLDCNALLELFLEKLDHWRQILIKDGFKSLCQIWVSRARQGQITARMRDETITGHFEGLDENGHLIVKQKDGALKKISAADVFFS